MANVTQEERMHRGLTARGSWVWIVGIIAFAAVACLVANGLSRRFYISSVGNKTYKIDRITGRSSLLVGTKEMVVEPKVPARETANEKAIRLAKQASSLDRYGTTNEKHIKNALARQKGDLRVIGWQAKQTDEQVFLVSLGFEITDPSNTESRKDVMARPSTSSGTYDSTRLKQLLAGLEQSKGSPTPGVYTYRFEVNLAAEIVRNVRGDPVLMKKYSRPGDAEPR